MMATPRKPLRWDEAHTARVDMIYVRHDGTAGEAAYAGPAPSVRVCRVCRRGREMCGCAWRSKKRRTK